MVGRKRKSAPAAEEAVAETPLASSTSRRRSTRAAATSSAKTSKYFEAPESESESDFKGNSKAATPSKKRGRGRPPKKQKVEVSDSEEFKDEPADEDDEANGDDNYAEPQDDAEEDEEEEEDDDDEDAPPKVTFIPLPKLRDTNGIAYEDNRLHPNTMAFLKDLKANNKRTWLKMNDKEYRRALKDWETYVNTITDKITEADPTIPELPFKDVNFRIYRDIRFSKNPTPYKPHFSAAFSRTGRKGPYACYYIHVEPGRCFVGGGLWHPEGPAVHKVRASIDERPQRWRRVLADPAFQSTFLPSASKTTPKKKGKKTEAAGGVDAEAAIKAFAEHNKENALKTRPKGFHPEHRDMELLKLKNYTVWKTVPDDTFTKKDGMGDVMRVVESMVGFVSAAFFPLLLCRLPVKRS
ncbi:hypothetical protein QBC35DRAFT_493459 [Podospora australis]|uniref:Uncharacterized protein n=1 Tax=Podospora australis TaxID=1536484 RepID=A0AAN6WW97_9PEZI|nr:hypothetical protein QBC35DRAFT_493459 [Podospora australis]